MGYKRFDSEMANKRKGVRFVEDGGLSDNQALRLSKRMKMDEDDDAIDVDEDAGKMGDKKSKHTLDSDEELEDEGGNLDMDNVDGQEEATTDFDEQTKITPFNMKDEMEEGHFDAAGSFVFDKNKAELKDAWLDGIDWGRVKKDAGEKWHTHGEDEEDIAPIAVNRKEIYKALLTLIQPKETAAKALARHGKGRNAAEDRKNRWLKKKQLAAAAAAAANTTNHEAIAEKVEEKKEEDNVTILTGLLDQLVAEGEMEVYGFTYEKIQYLMEHVQMDEKNKDKDDELDMFATKIDEKDEDRDKEPDLVADTTEPSSSGKTIDEVEWEFKWKNEEGLEIHGPCSSTQMQNWVDEGYFPEGVWVRKISENATNAPFYSSKRIDFDLYT